MKREGFLYDLGRIRRDLVPAVREIFSIDRIPPSVDRELSPEESQQFINSLIDAELRKELVEGVDSMEEGTHLSRDVVGTPEQGTRHAHDFVVHKEEDRHQLLYIDPEHGLGKNKNTTRFPFRRGDIRPRVNIMYGMELHGDGHLQRASLLRYRAAAIPEE